MSKICYLILAFNDPIHLKRMIDRLNNQADFYVHIDGKTELTPFMELLGAYPNVTFIENRENIYWGGFSIIKAEINLIRAALAASEDYGRYVLLSGADYPIKTNEEIHDFFDRNQNIEFIRGINLDELEDKALFGIHIDRMQKHDYPWIKHTNSYVFNRFRAATNLLLRMFPMPKKYRHRKFDLYHGSQWWALTRSCLTELLSIYDANPADYKNFKIGFASDEKFFHTLFFNSSFCNKNQIGGPDQPIVMKNRHEGDTSLQTSLLANVHIIDPSMTKWFDTKDFEKIMTSDKLFVRKVSTEHSTPLLNRIDSEILKITTPRLKEGPV